MEELQEPWWDPRWEVWGKWLEPPPEIGRGRKYHPNGTPDGTVVYVHYGATLLPEKLPAAIENVESLPRNIDK
jgi:hypothetical protein